jgi:hypothetical protein
LRFGQQQTRPRHPFSFGAADLVYFPFSKKLNHHHFNGLSTVVQQLLEVSAEKSELAGHTTQIIIIIIHDLWVPLT